MTVYAIAFTGLGLMLNRAMGLRTGMFNESCVSCGSCCFIAGSRDTVVEHWAADQQVVRAIMHFRHNSTTIHLIIPGCHRPSIVVQNLDIAHHIFCLFCHNGCISPQMGYRDTSNSPIISHPVIAQSVGLNFLELTRMEMK